MTPEQRHERDYIERTIATVRNHREADNCWPQWANIFADEIEALWSERDRLVAEHDEARLREAALREALGDAEPWLVVPSDVPEQHHETLGRVREKVRAALAAVPVDEPAAQPELTDEQKNSLRGHGLLVDGIAYEPLGASTEKPVDAGEEEA